MWQSPCCVALQSPAPSSLLGSPFFGPFRPPRVLSCSELDTHGQWETQMRWFCVQSSDVPKHHSTAFASVTWEDRQGDSRINSSCQSRNFYGEHSLTKTLPANSLQVCPPCWKANLRTLQEQRVLITPEPHLSLPPYFLRCISHWTCNLPFQLDWLSQQGPVVSLPHLCCWRRREVPSHQLSAWVLGIWTHILTLNSKHFSLGGLSPALSPTF